MSCRLISFAAAMLILSGGSSVSADWIVGQGYSLFQTSAPIEINVGNPGVNILFDGFDIGSFDFGDGNGPVDVGNTDTIIQRQSEADGEMDNGETQIEIEMVALSLRSVAPVSTTHYFMTLQDNMKSNGTMDIHFDTMLSGLFSLNYDLHYSIRTGSIDGNIIDTGTLNFLVEDIVWERESPDSAVLIDGVNSNLSDSTFSHDFFSAPFIATSNGATHALQTASVPEPAAFGMWAAMGLCSLGLFHRRASR